MQTTPTPLTGLESVCLVFVYNHRYEANIEKLERLYGERFRHIYHLMPFYRGHRPNVISVYANSFQFQAYFLDAWRVLQSKGFTHFAFVGDDLLLHPDLNEANIFAKLGLGANSASISYVAPVTDMPFDWTFQFPVLLGFVDRSGAQWEENLPPRAEAAAHFARHGWPPNTRFGWHNLHRVPTPRQSLMFLWYLAASGRWRRRRHAETGWRELPYPLVHGGADFLVVPASAMDEFCHLCGVFAALDIFVEAAAPTALAMACEHIAVQCARGWNPRALLNPAEIKTFQATHDLDIRRLYAQIPDDCLYVHPVKLSQWKLP